MKTPQERHARAYSECGKMFVAKMSRQRFCSRSCTEANWRKERPTEITVRRVRIEDGLTDYTHKIKRAPEVTVKRLETTLQPDILAICLEVRRANRRTMQAAGGAR